MHPQMTLKLQAWAQSGKPKEQKKKKEIAAKKHYISRWLHMHYLYSFLVYAN